MAAAVVAAVMAEEATTIRTAKEAAESARRRSRAAAMEAVEGGARCTAKAHVEEVVEHLILRRRAGLVSAHAGGAGRVARCFAGGAGSGRCACGRAAHRSTPGTSQQIARVFKLTSVGAFELSEGLIS